MAKKYKKQNPIIRNDSVIVDLIIRLERQKIEIKRNRLATTEEMQKLRKIAYGYTKKINQIEKEIEERVSRIE